MVERSLKRAILHRKNSLFYKTENGAEVGDLFMSLIHTCELNGVNPFDYLTELQKHAEELARSPAGADRPHICTPHFGSEEEMKWQRRKSGFRRKSTN